MTLMLQNRDKLRAFPLLALAAATGAFMALPAAAETACTASDGYGLDLVSYVDEVEASGVETLKQAGMQVNELTPDQKAAFRAALEGPYKDYEAQFGKDLMDRIQAEQ